MSSDQATTGDSVYSGTVVRCTYDWPEAAAALGIPPPDVDDLLETDGGATYLITQARTVRRRTRQHGGPRVAYVLLRLDPEHIEQARTDAAHDGHRMEGLRWHTRRRHTR